MVDRNEISAIAPSSLPNLRDPQSVRRALVDRLSLSEGISIVAKMLRGYPNAASAGDSYIGALAEILCSYPKCIAVLAGDLVKGVPRETKFLPTPADVIGWCERESATLRRFDDIHTREEALASERKSRTEETARLEAERAQRPSLDDLKAKYGPNWGLTTLDQATSTAKAAHLSLVEQANQREFERECAEAGVDPRGRISPSLAKIMRQPHETGGW